MILPLLVGALHLPTTNRERNSKFYKFNSLELLVEEASLPYDFSFMSEV